MSVRIGHASIDENGKATGGTAGDQTGKEVKISSWYDGSWDFVARAKDPAVAEAIAAAAEAGCNNPNIGYDQGGRNTLMTQAKAVSFDLSKITNACECDCSSFVSVCVRAALGKDFYSGNAPTTSTLKTVLKNTGAFEILTDSKYLTSDKYLRRGDILDRSGKHTVIVLDDGPNADKKAEAETETVKTAASPTVEATSELKLDYAASGPDKSKAGTYQVVSNIGLKLRTGASTSKAIIETMPNGSKVRCYGYYTGDWLFVVSASGKKGFCHRSYLRKV